MRSGPDKFVFGDYRPYPFFMGYAATYAAKNTDADVRFRDSVGISESYDSYFQYLKEEEFDMIFVESATPSWQHDRAILSAISEVLPDAAIVVAGPITANEETVFKAKSVKSCIKGEYEKSAVKVIEGAEGVFTHDLLTRDEMNDSPFPYMDDLHAHHMGMLILKVRSAAGASLVK